MKRTLVKLHLSIILASFTGIFGKLITLNESFLVWYRLIITTVVLLIFLKLTDKFEKIHFREAIKISGLGFLLTLHWITFYGSIKASNVSVGVVCFSLIGFFTAIFEPLISKQEFSFKEICFSFLSLIGIFLIFHFDSRYRVGVILGVFSSALASVFTIFNKKVSIKYSAFTLMFYQMAGGLFFLTLLMPLYVHYFPVTYYIPHLRDTISLLFFSFFCTIFMYALQIQVLREVSAFTVTLSYNLEPVYTIVLAALIFDESRGLGGSFYAGLGLIILSVTLQMFSLYREKKVLK